MTTEEWIKPGMEVAEYFPSRHTTARVNITTIERLTATQVVLAGTNRRYRRESLRPVGRIGSSWEPQPYLLRTDDEDVHNALAAAAVGDAIYAIDLAKRAAKVRNAEGAAKLLSELAGIVANAQEVVNGLRVVEEVSER